jgi:hypothetical protein
MNPNCSLCGTPMKKAARSTRGAANKLSGNMFILGGALLTLTCVGAIIGVPLMILGVLQAGRDQKIWLCPNCRHAVDRG